MLTGSLVVLKYLAISDRVELLDLVSGTLKANSSNVGSWLQSQWLLGQCHSSRIHRAHPYHSATIYDNSLSSSGGRQDAKPMMQRCNLARGPESLRPTALGGNFKVLTIPSPNSPISVVNKGYNAQIAAV